MEYIFRISKNFKEYDLKVKVTSELLSDGDTSIAASTENDGYAPLDMQNVKLYKVVCNPEVSHYYDAARELVADFGGSKDYYVLDGDEWVHARSWRKPIVIRRG